VSDYGQLRNLIAALQRSEWDLDQRILCAWRGQELKLRLLAFLEALKLQTAAIEDQEGTEASLILTYRLVGSFREAFDDSLPTLRQQLKETRAWIENRAVADRSFNEDRRTRRLLQDGAEAIERAATWPKPPRVVP
jgi:hypothetical protein